MYATRTVRDDSGSRFPVLDQPIQIAGPVPLFKVLADLVHKEYVRNYPRSRGDLLQSFEAAGTVRVRDLVSTLEVSQGWVYDPSTRDFYPATATHPVDDPDSFGRPAPGADRADLNRRGSVAISFRFRRCDAGISTSDLTAGATLEEFSGSMPEGVRGKWQVINTKSYVQGVESAQGVSGVVVNTQLQQVEAGLQFDALAARLPGQSFRVNGNLTISSFTGTNYDTTNITVPVDCDGKLGQWCRLVRLRGADFAFSMIFSRFLNRMHASASADLTGVDLEVRVE